MSLTLGYLWNVFSTRIMGSIVPRARSFSCSAFPYSWLGNYIQDNLGLDYKIDASVFSPYYVVTILRSAYDWIYKDVFWKSISLISCSTGPWILGKRNQWGKRNHWDGNSKCLVTISEKPFLCSLWVTKVKIELNLWSLLKNIALLQ